ncbi:unnamed protein product [Kuraishia capsulata CBS 1993]|uniref:C2H2-type domain-containing protein n=1 Tax=Kuraishia capsulata CBS 1993 TaxID=1382522 RepID=W6MU33_9ASCO|nr:uncharacterized protein KUCA_T00001375001 [Kuraishia capsulata CBS 1993]CDK25405.1 unnamed protein product [Kuraishia capsulata CBS 1993]
MPTEKHHACPNTECGATFKRRDHLTRHLLNHKADKLRCPRCDGEFSRPDLLKRHIRRHEQKDKEAGGIGLGDLIIRRKSWTPKLGYSAGRRRRNMSVNDSGLEDKSVRKPFEVPHLRKTNHVIPDIPNELNSASIADSHIDKVDTIDGGTNVASVQATDTLSGIPGISEETATEESPDYTISHNFTVNSKYDPDLQDRSTASEGSFAKHPFVGSNDFMADFGKPFATLRDYSWIFENLDDLSLPNHELSDKASSTSSSGQDFLFATKKLSPEVANKYNFESLDQLEQILPQITEEDRLRLLDFVASTTSRHSIEDGFDGNSEFFRLEFLQEFLELYFTKVNITYPIIHCSSFDPHQTHSLLLIVMITLGATYSTKAAHRAAVEIHDLIRGSLFSSPHFSATPELWVLQALLLIETFGRNKGGMRQHEVSNLFHGVLINILRKSDCLSTVGPVYSKKEQEGLDTEKSWREWIEIESKKRVAYFTFLWDVQHATIFGQTLGMSAFEIRIHLPADLNLWNAPSSTEWLKFRKSEGQQRFYLPTLKKYLNCSRDLPSINPLSRVLILHGLMSIAWDMQRKEHTSLGLEVDPYAWKTLMAKAYDCWKEDFEKFYSRVSRMVANSSSERFLVKFATTNSALYHSANILLWSNMFTLQIYAGAEHIFGRRVTQQTYDMAKKAVLQWSQQIGKTEKAVMHALQLLREGFVNLDSWEVDGTMHYNWCLYIATLTCWCYFEALSDSGIERKILGEANQNDPIDTDSLGYLVDDSIHYPETPHGRDAMGNFLLLVTHETPDRYRNLNLDSTCVLQEMVRHFRTARSGVIYEALVVLSNILARKVPNTEDVKQVNK